MDITPLHIAVLFPDYEIISLLIRHGASINNTVEDTTPLDFLFNTRMMMDMMSGFGLPAEDMPYTSEDLDEIEELLLENGATHGTGALAELAKLSE